MTKIEDDLGEETSAPKEFNRKKTLFILLPILIVIVIVASIFMIFNKDISFEEHANYTIVNKTNEDGSPNGIVVFYDLPEIDVQIKNKDGNPETLRMKIGIELNSVEDIAIIEKTMLRITDAIISHTIELTVSEVKGIEGLYWLKEELLYRLNLTVAPTKISGINFKNFEIQKSQR